MKLKSLISMMAVVAIVFAGCDKSLPEPENPKNPEQPTPEPVAGEITLQGEESLLFTCEGGSKNVSFEATLEWTATVDADFVTVGPAAGDAGEARVTIAVDENQTYDDRTATVTLTCGEDTKTIQVTQKKKGALVLAPSTIQVPSEGQSLSIVVQANSNVTAAIADDAKAWISELKGLVDYGFTFVIAPNEAVESRTGQIVFTNETGETETITLEQAGTPIVGKITLQGEDAFTVSDEGGQLEVAFNATLGWTASSSEEFVTVEPKTGEAGDVSVTLTVAENDSYDPRTATVTLTCDEDVKTIEITQKQKGALLFTESTIAVSAEGGNVEVVAKANSNVTYAIADDAKAWISELKGLVEYKFNFIVTVNESELARTGQIVFTNETGQTETVTIQQAGTEALSFAANFAVEGVAPFKTLWANGDVVAVNGVVSDALVLDAAAATAEFVVRDKLEAPFNAIYPASVLKAETADVITLPAQAYVTEVAPEVVLPMAAQAQEKALAFKQLCSVVKFTVKSEEAYKLDYAELSASQKLHGDFTVDYSFATLAAVGATDAEKTLRCELDNELTAEGVNLYFVVPAAEYTSLALRLVDVDGLPMTYTTTETFTAEAGTVVEVPAFEFKPDQISVATAADLVKFATQYNAKKLDTNVKVVLAEDITFDEETSAAFAATGGIGVKISDEETYYFNGAFDGNGKTIKGYVSSIPLFAYTGDGGEITNVHFDKTCQLKVNAGATDTFHALLVGRHKGLISDCTSAAAVVINNLEDVSTATQYYGGLVGRNYGGTVENSVVTGDITCTQTGVTISTNSASIGGVAGGQADKGTISSCAFKGNIIVSDGSDFGGISAAGRYFYVGGIVGYVENGSVLKCTAGDEAAPTKIELRGVLVPAVGGVASWVVTATDTEVSGCKNYMTMSFASNGARADTTPCRIGGIASRSMAPVSKSENYGAISSLGNSTSVYLGGIVGDGAGALNCTNHTTGTVTRTSQLTTAQGNRYMYIGGISGGINSAADFENCTNNAAVLNGNTGTSTNTTVDVGGIVGAAYDGGNSHQLDFKNCVNTGQITAQATQSTAIVLARTTVGGIIGYGAAASTTITDCNNSGYVYCQYNGAKSDGRSVYTGGIAGLLGTNATGVGGLEINGCDNTGIVYSRNYNNTLTLAGGSFGGGIVGAINGSADSKAKLLNCTSSVGNMNSYRGINGGIAGYAGNTTLSNNTASQAFNSNGNVEANGGVVGQLVGSDMSACTFSGSSFDPTSNTLAKNFGGLAYMMDATSSITNCKVDGATIKTGSVSAAVLVSNAAEGATITNCGVKGTLDGAAITLESTMIATGGASATGTYLLD